MRFKHPNVVFLGEINKENEKKGFEHTLEDFFVPGEVGSSKIYVNYGRSDINSGLLSLFCSYG